MHNTNYSFILQFILEKLSAICHNQKFSHLSRIPEACEPKHLNKYFKRKQKLYVEPKYK